MRNLSQMMVKPVSATDHSGSLIALFDFRGPVGEDVREGILYD